MSRLAKLVALALHDPTSEEARTAASMACRELGRLGLLERLEALTATAEAPPCAPSFVEWPAPSWPEPSGPLRIRSKLLRRHLCSVCRRVIEEREDVIFEGQRAECAQCAPELRKRRRKART